MGPKPVATLADTTAASRAFERIRVQWTRNDAGERLQLRKDIDAFVAEFPQDGLARLARIYGVLSLMDPPADWSAAERRLEAIATPPYGSTQDLYVVARAKLLRFHHDPQAAFDLLRPLVGSIVGSRARALLQEELTFDALESRQPYEAIAYMDAWLEGASDEDRVTSEAKVAVALGAVPEQALRGSLKAMRAGRSTAQAGQSHGYGDAIQRLIAERLGQIAVDRGDAELARWLLDTSGSVPLGEEVSSSLGQLATSRRGIGTVAGRTIGLVLPTSSADLRDEVADVLRGVLWALDIGRSDADRRPDAGDDPIRLVTRDDGGDAKRLRSALEEVAGEGAGVVITALDPETAREAEKWALEGGGAGGGAPISVILLAVPAPDASPHPSAASATGSVFSLGEDWPSELAALATALDRTTEGGTAGPAVATLGDTEALSSLAVAARADGARWQSPLSCDLAPTRAGDSRFPLGTWQQGGIRRWLVAGSATCAEDLVHGLRRGGAQGVVGLSLEASELRERPGPGSRLRLLTAAAGIVPLAAAPPGDLRARDAQAMAERTGAPEGWWTALGHDAAVLAKQALASLPPDTVSSSAEIAVRRAAIRRALLGVRAPLWTTDASGLDADRHLPRTIRTVELDR